jgi:hypothetical protein
MKKMPGDEGADSSLVTGDSTHALWEQDSAPGARQWK